MEDALISMERSKYGRPLRDRSHYAIARMLGDFLQHKLPMLAYWDSDLDCRWQRIHLTGRKLKATN